MRHTLEERKEIFKEKKREARKVMLKALFNAGYTCLDIAVALDIPESEVRSLVYDKNGQNENK